MYRIAATMLVVACGQQVGNIVPEVAPSLPYVNCTDGAVCVTHKGTATLDANWRWIHDINSYKNCYTGTSWDSTLCPDPKTCAKNCALEGVNAYTSTYGVTSSNDVLSLQYVVGTNVGSRLFLTDENGKYVVFGLVNKSFSIDVDVSEIPCGVNSAVYFVQIDSNGDKGIGNNKAGSARGTGYRDAQSPTDIKFVQGQANIFGTTGAAAPEIDILEINREALSFTLHPCSHTGACVNCNGYCDKSGADYNPYRQGNHDFYGPGKVLDSRYPFTAKTSFKSDSNGQLVEVSQTYVQHGKTIAYPNPKDFPGKAYISEESNSLQKGAFGEPNIFAQQGGMKSLTASRSLWDDAVTNMAWLDSVFPVGSVGPGSNRGPCEPGDTKVLRNEHGTAKVHFSNIRLGQISPGKCQC
jgi:cellulose 1,4-beta-cellobiosidase